MKPIRRQGVIATAEPALQVGEAHVVAFPRSLDEGGDPRSLGREKVLRVEGPGVAAAEGLVPLHDLDAHMGARDPKAIGDQAVGQTAPDEDDAGPQGTSAWSSRSRSRETEASSDGSLLPR